MAVVLKRLHALGENWHGDKAMCCKVEHETVYYWHKLTLDPNHLILFNRKLKPSSLRSHCRRLNDGLWVRLYSVCMESWLMLWSSKSGSHSLLYREFLQSWCCRRECSSRLLLSSSNSCCRCSSAAAAETAKASFCTTTSDDASTAR